MHDLLNLLQVNLLNIKRVFFMFHFFFSLENQYDRTHYFSCSHEWKKMSNTMFEIINILIRS